MKRPTMKVNGTRYTVMVEGSKVINANYPATPPHPGIPPCPKKVTERGRNAIKKWLGQACADADAEYARRCKTAREAFKNNPRYDVDIVLAFPEFEWQGGDLGPEVKWEEVKRGEIGAGMDLILPGGRRIHGRTVGVSDEKVIANAKRLEMEAARESREETAPAKSKLPAIDYTKRPPKMEEWAIAETIMGGMISKKKGISPYAIQRAMPAEWMKHPTLKEVRRPADSTFRNIAREMKTNGRIRRAHPRKDRVRI